MATTNKKEFSEIKICLAGMKKDIEYIKKSLDVVTEKMEDNYVTKIEFEPVRKIVYGIVSLILIAVVGAFIGLVIIR